MHNYRLISKLCILSKVYKTLINEQLSSYSTEHNILSHNQNNNTTTDAIKVLNYIIEAIDKGHHCASRFIDLSKHLLLLISIY